MVKNKLNSVQRMEVTFDRINQENILKSVLHSDAEKIRTTAEEIDYDAFQEAVNRILNADTIYVIGARSSAPLASFLGYYFNVLFDKLKLINTSSASELFEQLHRINQDDVLIGISFPRYSRSTLLALEFARNKNADIITITDSYDSPLTAFSECNLIARSDLASVVDSLVVPMSLINALIVAVYMRKQSEVVNTFEELEEIWCEYKVYKSDEETSPSANLEQEDRHE